MDRGPRGPTTPGEPRPPRFGLFPVRSPLLGESLLFSFPQGTKMFQFPWLASTAKMPWMSGLGPTGCPIRIPRGQGPFAPNPGFSQLTASFIASESQGIRRAPLYASYAWGTAPSRHGAPYTSAFSPLLGYADAQGAADPRLMIGLRPPGGSRCLINLLVFNYCHSMS